MSLYRLLQTKNSQYIIAITIFILLLIYYLTFIPLIDSNNKTKTDINNKTQQLVTMYKLTDNVVYDKYSPKKSLLSTITQLKHSYALTNSFESIDIQNNIANIRIEQANYLALIKFINEANSYKITVKSIKITKDNSGIVSGKLQLINN